MQEGSGLVTGATKDGQSVTADWQIVGKRLIEGVRVIEITSVLKRGGVLTEIFRAEWLESGSLAHVFQVLLAPGTVSAWHAHSFTTDRLFVASGSITLALYDGRADSPTAALVTELHLGVARPQLVVIPPGVWHGLIATGAAPALLLNLPDRAYAYEDPDHWRLPPDATQIPYRFQVLSEGLK